MNALNYEIVKRPILIGDGFVLVGFDEVHWKAAPVSNNRLTYTLAKGLREQIEGLFLGTALLLGYGTKIISSPSIVLNGDKKADFDKLLQIPKGYSNVAVLLIDHNDQSIDAITSASTRSTMDQKVKFIN